MNKKTKRCFLFFILIVLLFNSVIISAYAEKTRKIRQIDSNLPDLSFELEGKFDADDITSVKINNNKLTVDSAKPAKEADGKLVYMLIDISTSMSQKALDALKPRLISYADSLKKDDRLVVMTFGKSVKTVLSGGEKKSVVHNTINGIKCNSEGTAFYEAIQKAANHSKNQNKYERKYAIVVSDGADFDMGNSSQQEVVENIKTNILPFYGLCLSSTERSNAKGFGYIARSSGGEQVEFSEGNASSKFKKITGYINDVTIIKASSIIRKTLGECELSVKANRKDTSYSATDDINAKAKDDNTAPEVDEISYDKETNSFKIQFSEGVEKADNLSSYIIKRGNAEQTIVSVKYNDDETYAQLNMDKKIYSGEYTFEFKNITDNSSNENKLSDSQITEKIEATPIIVKYLIIVGIALIPVAFLLALYLILLNLKKKKNVSKIKDIFVVQEEVVENEHIKIEQKKGRKIRVHVQAGDGSILDVEYNLVSSMIVGRSNICDLTISDPNLSRQHFVVEDSENGLSVCDLETTNGTFINGVQIHSKTYLDNHSTISAGNSIIKIIY